MTTKAILVNLPQASFPLAWDVLADCSVRIDAEFTDVCARLRPKQRNTRSPRCSLMSA